MQTKKKAVRMRKPSTGELVALRDQLSQLKLLGAVDLQRIRLLEITEGTYMDVFEVPSTYARLLEGRLAVRSPYASGFYVGVLDKPTLRFKPSIPLAFRACRLCGLTLDCHIVDERGALIFTYGKPVMPDKIINIAGNLAPVSSENGYCLGWGKPCRRDTIKYLCPQGDVGWYLRRGG